MVLYCAHGCSSWWRWPFCQQTWSQHHCLKYLFPLALPLWAALHWPQVKLSPSINFNFWWTVTFKSTALPRLFMINRNTELPLIPFPTSDTLSDCSFLFQLSQMIKRNINNVRRMTSHPTLPYCESDSHLLVDFTPHFPSAAKKKVFVLSEVKKLKC